MNENERDEIRKELESEKRHGKTLAVMNFCRDLFSSNLIQSDFDDVQLFKVTGRDFFQQPGGAGLHVSFSVSSHAIGKTGKVAHEALDILLPEQDKE